MDERQICPVCDLAGNDRAGRCSRCGWNFAPLLGPPEELKAGLADARRQWTERLRREAADQQAKAARNREQAKELGHMTATLFDIGGSGLKTCIITGENTLSQYDGVFDLRQNPDWDNFVLWAYNNNFLHSQLIGISCPGFILNSSIIKLCRVCGWHDKNLRDEIHKFAPSIEIFLINDAEAHLMAHIGLYRNPLICISLGTSLGFAVCDKEGNAIRALDGANYDLGAVRIPTRASNNSVWWALGSHGLAELQNSFGDSGGAEHFGYRLGAFLVSICSIFRPASVVFSGGIINKWWDVMKNALIGEFNHHTPDWLEKPDFIKSPYCTYAALKGLAKYVGRKKMT
jgi:predicted NBD/HSP70 family sugar kinase